ncbi:hypothetical protein P4562_24070 [Lysinibacillus xylanilyticus]|uniref:hypothetical protein n=1 Tax=Lysinibacillus xylanilyticus TaxID=582475 RepID=UPI002E1BEF92|nr:hypothetical protein [Lysinibacillus xylanilyticus]
MIVIDNNSEQNKVKVLSVFTPNEIAVECDKSTLPQREDIKGKRAELYYDKDTQQLYYEYIDIPKTEIELLQEETPKMKLAIAESAEAQQRDKTENQLAVAELVETLTNKEVL